MRTLVIFGAVAALASSACSDETGILVNTTNGDGFAGQVDSLRYFVGTDVTDFSDSNYFLDESDIKPLDFEPRSLHDDPYRLLIRPPDVSDSGARYAIGALAYLNGEKVGFGYLADPIGFTDGSVTLWDLRIRPLGASDDAGSTEDCLRWQSADGGTGGNIGSANDRDCDGHIDGVSDCDPNNPEIFQEEGKAEICGNAIDDNCDGTIDGLMADGVTPVAEIADGQDNDCDGTCDIDNPAGGELDPDKDGFTDWGRYGVCNDNMTSVYDCNNRMDTGGFFEHPSAWDYCDDVDSNCDGDLDEDTPCFVEVEDFGTRRCLQGLRACQDNSLGDGVCEPISVDEDILGFKYGCQAEDQCLNTNDSNPVKCMVGLVRSSTFISAKYFMNCSTFHTDTGEVCSTNGGWVVIAEAGGPDNVQCTYQIIGPSKQQGYEVSLQSLTDGAGGVVLNECGARLNIKTTPASGPANIIIAVSRHNFETQQDLPGGLMRVKLSSQRQVGDVVITSCDAPEVEGGLSCGPKGVEN